eukprot:SAG11_NODE_402_length_9751_cov_7.372047_3_plen_161_part_00
MNTTPLPPTMACAPAHLCVFIMLMGVSLPRVQANHDLAVEALDPGGETTFAVTADGADSDTAADSTNVQVMVQTAECLLPRQCTRTYYRRRIPDPPSSQSTHPLLHRGLFCGSSLYRAHRCTALVRSPELRPRDYPVYGRCPRTTDVHPTLARRPGSRLR